MQFGYRLIIERHLIPSALGRKPLGSIDVDLHAYITAKRKKGLGPRTINRH